MQTYACSLLQAAERIGVSRDVALGKAPGWGRIVASVGTQVDGASDAELWWRLCSGFAHARDWATREALEVVPAPEPTRAAGQGTLELRASETALGMCLLRAFKLLEAGMREHERRRLHWVTRLGYAVSPDDLDLDRQSLAADVGGQGVQLGEHLLARLAGLDALLDAVHVGITHLRVLGDVCLQREERTDLGACVPAGSATRLQQLGDVGVLAVHERQDVLGCLRRDRKHAVGQVVGQPLREAAEQQLVEQRHGSPGVEVEQALGDVVEPMLLVVPEGVDGPQRPGLVLGQLEPGQ